MQKFSNEPHAFHVNNCLYILYLACNVLLLWIHVSNMFNIKYILVESNISTENSQLPNYKHNNESEVGDTQKIHTITPEMDKIMIHFNRNGRSKNNQINMLRKYNYWRLYSVFSSSLSFGMINMMMMLFTTMSIKSHHRC